MQYINTAGTEAAQLRQQLEGQVFKSQACQRSIVKIYLDCLVSCIFLEFILKKNIDLSITMYSDEAWLGILFQLFNLFK